MIIKITREEFENYALNAISDDFKQSINFESLTYMKRRGHESDSECYEKPDYYTIELTS